MHYVDWDGTEMYEFDTEAEAKKRMYEMVLAGWEVASTLYSSSPKEAKQEEFSPHSEQIIMDGLIGTQDVVDALIRQLQDAGHSD